MPERARHRRLTIVLVVILCAAVLGALLLRVGHSRRIAHQRRELARTAQAGPRVMVATVQPGAGERTVVLPGDVRAFSQVQLTARISGYLRVIHVDVGSRVSEGQVLATLESPQIEQQVRSALADLQNKQRLAERLRRLSKRNFVTEQDYEAARANARIAKAAYLQARELLAYAELRAPFSGIVTARYADPGALLQPGTPLVELRDADRLRVTVYAGQDVAPFLRVGDPAEIVQDELPGRVIRASVSRVAGGLDAASRTMQAEVWVDNRNAQLLPGVFVHVRLKVQTPALPVVPIEALVTRAQRTLVAVVEHGRVRFRPVELGVNDGTTVQIRSGVQAGQQVVLSPQTDLEDGGPIRPVRPPATARPLRNARTPAPR